MYHGRESNSCCGGRVCSEVGSGRLAKGQIEDIMREI